MIDSLFLIKTHSKGRVELPFSLLAIGTAVEKNGFKVKLMDLQCAADPSVEYVIDEINLYRRTNQEFIVGISSLSTQYAWVKKFILTLKDKLPGISVVVGGHIVVAAELLLNKAQADYICLKEGEEVLPELIRRINKGDTSPSLPGIAFKRNGEIIKHKNNRYLKEFEIPNLSLIKLEDYLVHPREDILFGQHSEYIKRADEDDKLVSIMFSRGCFGSCGFCHRHIPGYRQPPVDWCIEYLRLFYDRYGVKYFRFLDELFLHDREWLNEFYEKLTDSGMNILFRIAGSRTDCIDDDILNKLKTMGCIAVNYGIESGSQVMLDKMKKRTTVEQNRKAIRKTLEHGMSVITYYILGYQGETSRTLRETSDFMTEHGIERQNYSTIFPIPVPGTELYNYCLQAGIIEDEERYLEKELNEIAMKKKILKLGTVEVSELKRFRYKHLLLYSLNQKVGGYIPFRMLKIFVLRTTWVEYLLACFRRMKKICSFSMSG